MSSPKFALKSLDVERAYLQVKCPNGNGTGLPIIKNYNEISFQDVLNLIADPTPLEFDVESQSSMRCVDFDLTLRVVVWTRNEVEQMTFYLSMPIFLFKKINLSR